jgi:hypothetical protein
MSEYAVTQAGKAQREAEGGEQGWFGETIRSHWDFCVTVVV